MSSTPVISATGLFTPADSISNAELVESYNAYVARFNADGTGEWRLLQQGQNGLVVGARDPGDVSQSTTPLSTERFFSVVRQSAISASPVSSPDSRRAGVK